MSAPGPPTTRTLIGSPCAAGRPRGRCPSSGRSGSPRCPSSRNVGGSRGRPARRAPHPAPRRCPGRARRSPRSRPRRWRGPPPPRRASRRSRRPISGRRARRAFSLRHQSARRSSGSTAPACGAPRFSITSSVNARCSSQRDLLVRRPVQLGQVAAVHEAAVPAQPDDRTGYFFSKFTKRGWLARASGQDQAVELRERLVAVGGDGLPLVGRPSPGPSPTGRCGGPSPR